MGHLLVGGRITRAASEEDFRSARAGLGSSVGSGFVEIPNVKPLRGTRGINKVQDSLAKQGTLDVTRNAPLFNDPRYTSSTLAINGTVALKGNFKMKNLAICRNPLRTVATNCISNNATDWATRREVRKNPSETTRQTSLWEDDIVRTY
jgi:hypothetical protein